MAAFSFLTFSSVLTYLDFFFLNPVTVIFVGVSEDTLKAHECAQSSMANWVSSIRCFHSVGVPAGETMSCISWLSLHNKYQLTLNPTLARLQ
jgi:hypothetical protein